MRSAWLARWPPPERSDGERWQHCERLRLMAPQACRRLAEWAAKLLRTRRAEADRTRAVVTIGLDAASVQSMREAFDRKKIRDGPLADMFPISLEAGVDLMVPQVAAALLDLAAQGLLAGTVAWPPSSTWAASRFQGGPDKGRPLRAHCAHEWGLPNLMGPEKLLVADENACLVLTASILMRVKKSGGLTLLP